MRRAMRVALLLAVSTGLAGCDTMNWERAANGALKDICRGQSNCYATCPDGTRTDPNTPYCPGERPQDQPEPF